MSDGRRTLCLKDHIVTLSAQTMDWKNIQYNNPKPKRTSKVLEQITSCLFIFTTSVIIIWMDISRLIDS